MNKDESIVVCSVIDKLSPREKIIRRSSNPKSMNLLLNNWLNTFQWTRRLDIKRVRMTLIKFMRRNVPVPISKITSLSFKITIVLKNEKKHDPTIEGY